MSLFKTPKAVFVPFEWDGRKWAVRNDLPRFREPIEAAQYLVDHPEISFTVRKQPVYLQWQERDEQMFIDEYLSGHPFVSPRYD